MRLGRAPSMFLLALFLLLHARDCEAHSWLACVDYQCTGPAPASEAACTCNGYPRNWATVMNGASFSQDRGRDNRPGASPAAGGLFCDPQKEPNPGAGSIDALYSTTYPAAQLAQGQTVRWRWPAKNHATVGVQRGVQVYLSTTANQGDVFPAAATATDIYAEMDFSNCDPRQAGVDGADCQDEFTIKTSTPPGRYTMMWWWEFNAGEFYNTCADVIITAAEPGTPLDPPDNGSPGQPGGPVAGPGPSAPAQTCVGSLVGECQTDLDLHRVAAAAMLPPADTTYCIFEGQKLASNYGQIVEIRDNIDLSPLSSVANCAQLFTRMDSLCTQLASVAQNLSFGKDPDAGYTFGNVFLGIVFGFGAGLAFYKWGLPKLLAKAGAAPPPSIQMAPPPPVGGFTVKQASAYKNLGGAAAPPPPPGPPPPSC